MRKLLVVAVLLSLATLAAAQTKPVLVIPFNGDVNGVKADGTTVPGVVPGTPQFAPGKAGQALKSGATTSETVCFPTEGILSPKGGTVEMWVCPLDWTAAQEEFHVFFDARGEGALYLYHYYQGPNLLMLTCENANGPYTSAVTNMAAWKPGEWHHIAGTWCADGVMSYVDGKPGTSSPTEGPLPKSFDKLFRIGDDPWHIARKTSSLIQDVRIYDKPLSSAHIAAHFAGNYNFTVPLRQDLARVTRAFDPAKNELRLTVNTGGADVADAGLQAQFAVVAKGAALPDDAAKAAFVGGQATGSLAVTTKEPGEYEIVARVFQDGKTAFDLRQPFIIPDLSWRGNKIGLEDKVLPPWTPMKVSGTTVSCWGRQYSFDKSPLPTQITSAGAALLHHPMRLVTATGEGLVQTWQPQTLKVNSASSTRVVVTGDLTGSAGGRPVVIHAKVTTEYDGVALLELTCDQPEKLALVGLKLDIPVKAAHAMYYRHWWPEWADHTGNLPQGSGAADKDVPQGSGIVDKDKFIPYYWLGDNDRGLFWFCESDEMWPNAGNPSALEVLRLSDGVLHEDDAVVLRLNLLAKGQKLPANWKFVCGLQATPVKPIPKDWRKWRLAPAHGANVDIMWPSPAKDSLRYYGYPEATDPALFAKSVAALHAQKTNAVPYLCLSFLSEACPEWPYFKQQWAMGGADAGSSDVAAYGAPFAIASPVGKDYSDFIVWKNQQFLERYHTDGQYHDNSCPYDSTAIDAGCGYMRDGKAHRTFPMLGYRALYRRMATVVKSLPRETFTMAHMSGKLMPGFLGYDDSYLDGENFRTRVKDSYLDVLPLDTFRAEFMGRQWGIMPFFIPELSPPYDGQVEPTRGMMALLMLHDVSPWAIWCNVKVLDEAWAALDKFGYVDSDFIPYFAPTPPAATAMKDVYVSAYKRADGKALLIVANLSREDRQGEVSINAKRLGLPLGRVLDWPSGAALSAPGGKLELEVPKLGYRMIVVSGK